MHDEIVKYPTAKLAKEKGFNENTRFGFNGLYEPHHLKITEFGYLQRNSELLDNIYSAPTQSLLQKWLREVHNVNITPPLYYTNRGYACTIIAEKYTIFYKTYEDALEDELYKQLTKI